MEPEISNVQSVSEPSPSFSEPSPSVSDQTSNADVDAELEQILAKQKAKIKVVGCGGGVPGRLPMDLPTRNLGWSLRQSPRIRSDGLGHSPFHVAPLDHRPDRHSPSHRAGWRARPDGSRRIGRTRNGRTQPHVHPAGHRRSPLLLGPRCDGGCFGLAARLPSSEPDSSRTCHHLSPSFRLGLLLPSRPQLAGEVDGAYPQRSRLSLHGEERRAKQVAFSRL